MVVRLVIFFGMMNLKISELKYGVILFLFRTVISMVVVVVRVIGLFLLIVMIVKL